MALTDNLVLSCELDEASGDAIDSHGSHDGTDTNTVGSGTGLVHAASRDFEIDNGELFSFADDVDLRAGLGSFEFGLFANPETLGGFDTLMSKGWSDLFEKEFALIYFSGNIIWNVRNAANDTSLSVSTGLTTGSWQMIHFWHDAANGLIGISVNNGTPVTTALSGGCNSNTKPLLLGTTYDGLAGPFRLWRRVLSGPERTELYNAGAGLTYAALSGGGGGTTVTPTTLALTTTTFAPTVTAGGSQTVTPSTLALAMTGYAPTVSATSSGSGSHPFRSALIQGMF